MANQDYYSLLGVSKGASEDEIKKAFRKKAHAHHPDKGGDAEEFKKINEAYQVLSDKQKRQQYDTYGSAGPQGGFGGGQGAEGFDFGGFGFNFGGNGGGFADIFSDMFGAAMANISAEVEISVPQAVLGDTMDLRVGNEKVTLNVPAGAQDGTQMVFRGKGRAYRGGKGDLTLILRVVIPRRLSKRQKELYEELKKLG
ncbi:MAG: molecular chaperone DnaJ [Patescibacteria group bacterium]|jgi:DnaJ-class molecular chaperone|nr:molecular chaperone DnaJ [Patescibacteria group bacterium]